jgi:hypothetical protein
MENIDRRSPNALHALAVAPHDEIDVDEPIRALRIIELDPEGARVTFVNARFDQAPTASRMIPLMLRRWCAALILSSTQT